MATAADAVRSSARLCTLISLAIAAAFFVAAGATGSPPVARYGGALWVFLLSLLITLPLVTPVLRRRAGTGSQV